MDNTNQICIQDVCIKQYAAFDTEQMFNFSRDVCHVCGDTPVCRYYNGTSCKPCFYFFKRSIKFEKEYGKSSKYGVFRCWRKKKIIGDF